MTKAEKLIALRHDMPMIEQVLIKAISVAGWKSSLMTRNKITSRPMAKIVTHNGSPFEASFSAVLTWIEQGGKIDMTAVVTESRSNDTAAVCNELCAMILEAIPTEFHFRDGAATGSQQSTVL